MRRLSALWLALFCVLTSPAFSLGADTGDIKFYGPCWADASGRDGKGGVSITTVGDKHNLVVRPEDGPNAIDADSIAGHPDWALYRGNGTCLAFEPTWITTAGEKYFSRCWAGFGLAFNDSWGTVDVTSAKYLVMDVRVGCDGGGYDYNLTLNGDGDKNSGSVSLSSFVEGRKLTTKWAKVVIPFTSIPNLSTVNLAKLKTLRFDLNGHPPENKLCFLYMDNIHFSVADLLTPVENLGWLKTAEGVVLVWDKAEGEQVKFFTLSVDGKKAAAVDAAERRAVLPMASLKGAGPHVVSVSAANDKSSSSPQSVTITPGNESVQTASVTLSDKPGRDISPYVNGQNGWGVPPDGLKKLGATVNRWGGNATTNYNWKEDADNRGMDWYFLNTANSPPGSPETDKNYYKFVKDTLASGSAPMVTIPIIGWVAKAPPPGKRLSSYPLSLFPNQEANDQGAGNGRLPDNKGFIWDNDPSLNYVKSDPAFQKGWVEALVKDFGSASKGGVKFYNMDNEPGLWCWNHRDVRPKGIGYDELPALNAQYAAMVKSVDPDAQIVGMVSWGVKELAGSSWDYMPGGVKGYKLPENAIKDNGWTDRKAHDDVPQVVFFLKEMNRLSKKAGVRLLDYLDNHGFPEVWGTDAKGNKINVMGDFPYDPILTPKQFDGLRIFYDPTFESPDSWCANPGNKSKLFDPFRPLIPNLRKMVEENYPGTKLAMSEYYPASAHYFHGGLLEVVNLGIFMREGMDLACDWGGSWAGNYVSLGHKLVGNYDDKGSSVGGKYVDCTSSSSDLYSFGAKDGVKTYVILVDKNHDTDLDTTITLPAAASTYDSFLLAENTGKRLFESGSQKIEGKVLKLRMPAFSAMLVVVQ